MEIDSYKKRLGEMYASEDFKKYSVYPTTNAVHVFAVIAMCLGLKCFNMSDREIIKIFCMTDTTSYENLPKHVKFIRHSDLSDGNCCHDEIINSRGCKSV